MFLVKGTQNKAMTHNKFKEHLSQVPRSRHKFISKPHSSSKCLRNTIKDLLQLKIMMNVLKCHFLLSHIQQEWSYFTCKSMACEITNRQPDRQSIYSNLQFLIKIEATEIYFTSCTCLIRHSPLAGHSEMWLQSSDMAPTVLVICHYNNAQYFRSTHTCMYVMNTAGRDYLWAEDEGSVWKWIFMWL